MTASTLVPALQLRDVRKSFGKTEIIRGTDLVVQSGGFPRNAASLNEFVRESEVRLWVFVAIDRLSGEILEQQTEWISN